MQPCFVFGQTEFGTFALKEVGAQVADAGHHGRAVTGADTAGIFGEGNVKPPVQGIPNPPMPTDCFGEQIGRGACSALSGEIPCLLPVKRQHQHIPPCLAGFIFGQDRGNAVVNPFIIHQ